MLTPSLSELLERRTHFTVSVDLTGATLNVTGDGAADVVQIATVFRNVGDALARDGTTSVFLDTTLLASAAGLTLSGASSSGTPFDSSFQVGFPILRTTNFRYETGTFAPIAGEIRHSGTVSFNNNAITVGNFSIGFDPARVGGERSGFFVRDNAGGLGILFDVGAPASANVTTTALSLSGADLLVSSEFAAQLQTLGLATTNLTGADVGNARIDARSIPILTPQLRIRSPQLAGTTAFFRPSQVENLNINLGGGNDFLNYLSGPRFSGSIAIDAGDGDDFVRLTFARAASLSLTGGAGDDRFAVRVSDFDALDFTGGDDDDTLILNLVSADTFTLAGDAGLDRLFRTATPIGAATPTGFEVQIPA